MRKLDVLVGAASATAVLGVTLLATSGDARSPSAQLAAAPPATYVGACEQKSGPKPSVGDLNARKSACGKGQKQLKLALFAPDQAQGPTAALGSPGPEGPLGPSTPAPSGSTVGDYAVANVFVKQGSAAPAIWATYSEAMGSPIGTTTGGEFRFTCSAAQAPCKISIAAAVLSGKTGSANLHARVLIFKQPEFEPEVFCEYADGATESTTPAAVSRVPMSTAVGAINSPLDMAVGSSHDCGAGQPAGSPVKEIWVPAGPTGRAFYNVFTTFAFK